MKIVSGIQYRRRVFAPGNEGDFMEALAAHEKDKGKSVLSRMAAEGCVELPARRKAAPESAHEDAPRSTPKRTPRRAPKTGS